MQHKRISYLARGAVDEIFPFCQPGYFQENTRKLTANTNPASGIVVGSNRGNIMKHPSFF